MNKVTGTVITLLVFVQVGTFIFFSGDGDASEKADARHVITDKAAREQQRTEVGRLLIEERFAELESYARDLNRRKAHFPGGGWRIQHFFASLSETYKKDEESMQQLIAILERWRIAYPESAMSQTALGVGLNDWAYFARGKGYADEVTAEGWKKFHERLTRAWQILEQPFKGADCPMRHTLRFEVAFLMNLPDDVIEKTYADAVASEPLFYYNIFNRANYLQPKWGGKPGQWAHFVERETARMNKFERDTFTARIAANMLGAMTYQDILDVFPWKTLKPSFEKLVKVYDDPTMHSWYLWYACFVNDYEAVVNQSRILGDQVEFNDIVFGKESHYTFCINRAEIALGLKEPSEPEQQHVSTRPMTSDNLLKGITWQPTGDAKAEKERLLLKNGGKLEAQGEFEFRHSGCVLIGATVKYSKPREGVTGTPMFMGDVNNGSSNSEMIPLSGGVLLVSPKTKEGSAVWWKTYPFKIGANHAKATFGTAVIPGEDKTGGNIEIINPLLMIFNNCEEANAFGKSYF